MITSVVALVSTSLLLATVAPSRSPSLAVGQWDRFEVVVENPKRYADPFRDVTLEATFRGPDGGERRFWGFHDGGSTWRLRFMPDRIGRWQWSATFSDGTPGGRGTFRCVRSRIPGMVSADEHNPIWFGYKGGRHLLVRSFHVGDRFFAANWPDDKRKAFLDWAVGQGYNMLSIASHYLNRDIEGRGRGWQTPALWPLDPAAYRALERHLDDLAARRLLVYPFAGFFGRDAHFPREPADQTLFIRYTLARLGPYWNVLLNVAGPEPNLKDNVYLTADEVVRLGREIRSLDPFGHLLGIHNATGDDPYVHEPWVSFTTMQGPKTLDRRKLAEGLLANHHPAKPLYAQETLWSGNKYHTLKSTGADYSDEDLRKNAYVVTMSAAALNFGDMRGDSSSGFSGTLELADRVQHRHDLVKRVWDFFATVPWWRLRPCPALVDTGHCLAEEGKEYLVYLERPTPVSVQVRPGAPYTVEWIDARDPRNRRRAGKTRDAVRLTPPEGGDDWLLRLRR